MCIDLISLPLWYFLCWMVSGKSSTKEYLDAWYWGVYPGAQNAQCVWTKLLKNLWDSAFFYCLDYFPPTAFQISELWIQRAANILLDSSFLHCPNVLYILLSQFAIDLLYHLLLLEPFTIFHHSSFKVPLVKIWLIFPRLCLQRPWTALPFSGPGHFSED